MLETLVRRLVIETIVFSTLDVFPLLMSLSIPFVVHITAMLGLV
jgi:hypothetical protein